MTPAQRPMLAFVIVMALAAGALAQGGDADGPPEPKRQTMLGYIQAGGFWGYVIIAMSFVGVALVVDGFVKLKEEKLIPPAMVEQSLSLAQRGRFGELLTLVKTQDTLFSRTVAAGLSQGSLGVEAVREGMRQQGEKEITALRQRMGYIGFVGAVAPMLGLLGTVVGMVMSFQVLGVTKGSASPADLATGIAVALITTCEGLIVAIPMMFFHTYFRDRITRIGQKAAGDCERVLRVMSVVVESRQPTPGARPSAPQPESAPPVSPRAVGVSDI